MAINYEELMAWQFDDVVHSYTSRDTMLYALGLGLGADPTDEKELCYVYEDGLQALPTMAVVLGMPKNWLRQPGMVDFQKVVHGEQWLTLHRPLPPEGTVVGRSRIAAVVDKGAGKGAIVCLERTIFSQSSDEPLATVMTSAFARGDGGFGGPASDPNMPPPHKLPESAPQNSYDFPTLPRQALLYRLSGDYNPLHADPKMAKSAGFPVPILHGLCSYGIAGFAIVSAYCGGQADQLRSLQARFSAPVYPGETLRTEMWRDGDIVSFRCKVVERDLVVLTNGRAEIKV